MTSMCSIYRDILLECTPYFMSAHTPPYKFCTHWNHLHIWSIAHCIFHGTCWRTNIVHCHFAAIDVHPIQHNRSFVISQFYYNYLSTRSSQPKSPISFPQIVPNFPIHLLLQMIPSNMIIWNLFERSPNLAKSHFQNFPSSICYLWLAAFRNINLTSHFFVDPEMINIPL